MLRMPLRGFSLAEVLVAMAFGSAIMLAAMQFYPTLRRQSQNTLHHFQLERMLQQVGFSVMKDLRRAGFCATACQGNAVRIGQLAGEPLNSCVIIAYDSRRAGSSQYARETYGYRLRAGTIETMVGAEECGGNGWERLLEPRVATVTQFQIGVRRSGAGTPLYEIQMTAHWPKRPEIARRSVRWVAGWNA